MSIAKSKLIALINILLITIPFLAINQLQQRVEAFSYPVKSLHPALKDEVFILVYNNPKHLPLWSMVHISYGLNLTYDLLKYVAMLLLFDQELNRATKKRQNY
jgi:hypothetical protein